MKWRFAAKFLLTFAALVVVWQSLDVAVHYRRAALATARLLSPAVNGWALEYDRPGSQNAASFHRVGRPALPMLLELPALSMGLMPFLSLIVATPGLGWRRLALTAAGGMVLYFLIHVSVVLVYPLIMDQPNTFKDTLGVFSGLVAFVVAPLALWFILTYPALRTLWRLSAPQPAGRTPLR